MSLFTRTNPKKDPNLHQEGAVLTLSKQLPGILGFEPRRFDRGVHTIEYHMDIDEGMSAIYVCSSIVQNQLAGDSLMPLLGVVPIRGGSDELYHHKELRHPYHLPTVNETTSGLTIYLRRDDGAEISFTTRKVVLTLHFRPI